ncbi:citrate lyase holo-[acyl-carrier protein] synthase [Geosporobacter ferrireducens]|uniref:citrate lyase holo-[acyl-carrier protein] synthase n=1 Tax=Geosporobacter ferrireducens TaxID=1424294 RepID=UPI00139E0C7F|nr:citrate lyase holo-[acyl-carrier protein] synthase [Geosporobacter ferrireducens]MTI56600.1 citrate lyase holo-[acyl-carrier protein] synthase [Geosporobacter ferrireducens]
MIITLEEILSVREARSHTQKVLLKRGNCLISFTMNIPGNEKRSNLIDKGFEYGVELIDRTVRDCSFKRKGKLIYHYTAGSVGFWLLDSEALNVKEAMISIEEASEIARLFDIDVITNRGILSRKDFGLSPRTCLICNREAHFCARSQAHSYEQLSQKVKNLLETI